MIQTGEKQVYKKRKYSAGDINASKSKLSTLTCPKKGIDIKDYKPIFADGAKFRSVDISKLSNASLQEKRAIEEMSLKKWAEHMSQSQSIISDVLLGQYLSKLECTVCQTSSYNFEPFYLIEAAIPEDADELSIIDLLEYSTRPDLLEGFLWNCPKCKKDRQVTKTNYIYKLPSVLAVCYKRFEMVNGQLMKNNCLITTELSGEDLSKFEKSGSKSTLKEYVPYMIVVS